MEERIQKIEQELEEIKRRNQRVEYDKAWETSAFRVLSIAAITYVVASIVMWLIGSAKFYLNALVPVVGYLLSTQSLPAVKKWWIGRRMGSK